MVVVNGLRLRLESFRGKATFRREALHCVRRTLWLVSDYLIRTISNIGLKQPNNCINYHDPDRWHSQLQVQYNPLLQPLSVTLNNVQVLCTSIVSFTCYPNLRSPCPLNPLPLSRPPSIVPPA